MNPSEKHQGLIFASLHLTKIDLFFLISREDIRLVKNLIEANYNRVNLLVVSM